MRKRRSGLKCGYGKEFGIRHRTAKARSAAIFAAWALAAAAVLLASVNWWNWRLAQTQHSGVRPRRK